MVSRRSTLRRSTAVEDLDAVSKPAYSGWPKRGSVSPRCGQKLARLQAIVAERTAWASQIAQVKRMHGWVLEVEHILDGSLAQEAGEVVSKKTVGQRLDVWRKRMAKHLTTGTLSEREQTCLTELLRVLTNLWPYLLECYNRTDFPRTNNEMERSIRGLKRQYRRISGRKNWNAYLVRYGRCVAYAAWWEQDAAPSAAVRAARCLPGPCPVARTPTRHHRCPP